VTLFLLVVAAEVAAAIVIIIRSVQPSYYKQLALQQKVACCVASGLHAFTSIVRFYSLCLSLHSRYSYSHQLCLC
jgi:hypothetical protein